MKSFNFQYFCSYFFSVTGIPVRHYIEDNLSEIYPDISPALDPATKYVNLLMNDSMYVTYKMTNQFVCYGIVKLINTNHSVIIGPAISAECSRRMIMDIMNDASLSLSHTDDFANLIKSFPIISFNSFLSTLGLLNFCINNKAITSEGLILLANDYYNFQPKIVEAHTSNMYIAKEETQVHNTYAFEKQIYSYVASGNISKLKSLLDYKMVGNAGTVARDPVRQYRNIFITTTTMTTRAAIEGGLDIETAYHLSDIYIQQVETLQSTDTISMLQQQMIFDFTERVAGSQIKADVSSTISDCLKYVNNNTNKPIQVIDVANYVGMSKSYISKKFKEEVNLCLSEYITKQKIEESKELLQYTHKSLSEISTYLCFSTQSYFQNVFKKLVGMTPLEYRNKKASSKQT